MKWFPGHSPKQAYDFFFCILEGRWRDESFFSARDKRYAGQSWMVGAWISSGTSMYDISESMEMISNGKWSIK